MIVRLKPSPIWYGVVRFALEPLRQENWTFNGIPTASLVSLAFIAVGVGALLWRHRPGHEADAPATRWRDATWGALGAIPEGADAELDEADEDDVDEVDEFDEDDEFDDEADDDLDDDDEYQPLT